MKQKRPLFVLLLMSLVTLGFLFIQIYLMREKFFSEKNSLIRLFNESLQISVNSFKNYHANHPVFIKELAGATVGENTFVLDSSSVNLLSNGSFEEDSLDFETEYSRLLDATQNIFPNKFGWIWPTDDAQKKTLAWNGKAAEGRRFLLVDGASVPGLVFWRKKITVKPGKNYRLCFKTASMIADSGRAWRHPLVRVHVNGVPCATVVPPANTGIWTNHSLIWNSGSSAEAIITFEDVNTSDGYNDFGVDDLAFYETDETVSAFRKACPVKLNDSLQKVSAGLNLKEIMNDILKQELSFRTVPIEYEILMGENGEKSMNFRDGAVELSSESGAHYFDVYYLKKGQLYSNCFFFDDKNFVQCALLNMDAVLWDKIRNEIILLLIMFIASCILFISIRKYMFRSAEVARLKYQIINNINHELKTPLSAMSAAIEALQSFNRIDNKEKTEQYLEIARKQVHKLDRIIDSSFQLAKAEEEDFKLTISTVYPEELLNRVIEERKESPGNQAAFVFVNESPGTCIPADSFHLFNIFSTVIDNAIKYSGAKPDIKILMYHDKDFVFVSVKDKGVGIEKKYHRLIFDKFFRVPGDRHDVKGHGLGLSYVKLIMDLHRGFVTVNSELNKGTEIILKLRRK